MNLFDPSQVIAYLIAVALAAFALTIYWTVEEAHVCSCSIGESVKTFLAGLLLVGLAVFAIAILAYWVTCFFGIGAVPLIAIAFGAAILVGDRNRLHNASDQTPYSMPTMVADLIGFGLWSLWTAIGAYLMVQNDISLSPVLVATTSVASAALYTRWQLCAFDEERRHDDGLRAVDGTIRYTIVGVGYMLGLVGASTSLGVAFTAGASVLTNLSVVLLPISVVAVVIRLILGVRDKAQARRRIAMHKERVARGEAMNSMIDPPKPSTVDD